MPQGDLNNAHIDHNESIPEEARQFDDETLHVFARVGRLTPRQAISLLQTAAREVRVGILKRSTDAVREHYREVLKADELGLIPRDRDYLRLLFPDRVIGLDAIAAQLGEGSSSIASDLEPYLLRLGLIERTRSGRKLTSDGREFVAQLPQPPDPRES